MASKYASVSDITSSLEPNLFFWSIFFLRSENSRLSLGSDLENRVGAEATRSAIHVVLVSLQSNCDTVKEHFFLICCRFLGDYFLQTHQLCYIIFAIDCSSFHKVIDEQSTLRIQNTEAKTLLLMFASLVALDGYYLLLFTQLTADLTLEWRGGCLSIVTYLRKNSFCCVQTVDRLWVNAAPNLNTAFSLTNAHAKWWIHCLLISSIPLLSYATSIYDRPKRVCGVFWCFLGNCRIWATCAFGVIVSCATAFKVSIPSLTVVSDRSRVWITLIKL